MDFEKLYRTYYMQVYSYVMTLTKDSPSAEEITQNTFYKAMTSREKFAGKSSELTWLCSIAKRLAIDEFRKTSKRESPGIFETTVEDAASSVTNGEDIAKSLEDKELAFRIHVMLHRLEDPYKEVFQLRVFGELPFFQIANIFGKSENWARVTYHRARLKLQERLDKNE